MSAKELYNKIIFDIEDIVSSPCEDAQTIVKNLCQKYAMNARDLSSVFNFMTGEAIIGYIKY